MFSRFFFGTIGFAFGLKKEIDGFFINALQTNTNFPTFSIEIAAPRFLLLSIGSIITIWVSNFLVGFPMTWFCFNFAIALITSWQLPKCNTKTSVTYPLIPCLAISEP